MVEQAVPGDLTPCDIQIVGEDLDSDELDQLNSVRIRGERTLDTELLPRDVAERCEAAYWRWIDATDAAIAWWKAHGQPRVPGVDDDDFYEDGYKPTTSEASS
ncbi:MAG: hypothetical protein ACYCZN_01275 [Candidatus Dormibacteria bacterium]